jgi:hypothetical protein
VVDQPGEGTLHHPTFWGHSEAAGRQRRMGDDQLPAEVAQQPRCQTLTEVGAVGPQHAQATQERSPLLQQPAQPRLVLHVGWGDQYGPQQAQRVDQDVALAAFDVLAAIEAARPPLSAVGTDWLSTLPALGSGARPTATRTCRRSWSCTHSHLPS